MACDICGKEHYDARDEISDAELYLEIRREEGFGHSGEDDEGRENVAMARSMGISPFDLEGYEDDEDEDEDDDCDDDCANCDKDCEYRDCEDEDDEDAEDADWVDDDEDDVDEVSSKVAAGEPLHQIEDDLDSRENLEILGERHE